MVFSGRFVHSQEWRGVHVFREGHWGKKKGKSQLKSLLGGQPHGIVVKFSVFHLGGPCSRVQIDQLCLLPRMSIEALYFSTVSQTVFGVDLIPVLSQRPQGLLKWTAASGLPSLSSVGSDLLHLPRCLSQSPNLTFCKGTDISALVQFCPHSFSWPSVFLDSDQATWTFSSKIS